MSPGGCPVSTQLLPLSNEIKVATSPMSSRLAAKSFWPIATIAVTTTKPPPHSRLGVRSQLSPLSLDTKAPSPVVAITFPPITQSVFTPEKLGLAVFQVKPLSVERNTEQASKAPAKMFVPIVAKHETSPP